MSGLYSFLYEHTGTTHGSPRHSDREPLVSGPDDGRTIAVLIVWLPRLAHGTSPERAHFQISGAGYGMQWELLTGLLS